MTEDTEKQEAEALSVAEGAPRSAAQKNAPQAEKKDYVKEREEQRKARAAQKLRENLQRRKQQSRARRSGAEDQTIGLPAAKTDESC